MRKCKYCFGKTRGRCSYCGYVNKRSNAETIYNKLVEYDKFLCTKNRDIPKLRKKLWEIFKPLLNNLQKKALSKAGF